MSLKLPYIQPRGKRFRYRRAVPRELRDALGQNEIVLPLGRNEQEVARNYSKVHEKAEKLLETVQGGNRDPESEFEAYKLLLERLRERGIYSPSDLQAEQTLIDPLSGEEKEVVSSPFEQEADALAEKYEGQPASQIPPADLLLIRALSGSFPEPPDITLGDAKKSYLEAKEQEGKHTFRRLRNNTNKIVGIAEDYFGKNTKLSEIRRPAAREFVKSLLATHISSTVTRRLSTLKAVINHAITELELNISNPFTKITVKDTSVARDKRQPFTESELDRIWKRIQTHAGEDLRRLWVILWGTGCRLEEVSGIGISEIVLDHEVPHLNITPNAVRGVEKGAASRRLVPLVGLALEATQEALEALPDGAEYLFPGYAKYNGATNASAALMKHVRKITTDKQKVVYSLRHNAKDAMIKAGVNDHLQEMIFGRNSGGIGSIYGSNLERLKAMREALIQAELYNIP
jgi:integrase